MGRARRLAGSRRFRIGLNAVFVSGALAAATLTILHFVHSGWPLANADPLLVVAAGILFLFAYAFKAWGWQRLFPEGERPEALTLAAAGGAASVGGVALPGRFDEAIRIAVVRRGPGKKTSRPGRDLPHPDHRRSPRQRRPGADGVGRRRRFPSRRHPGGLRVVAAAGVAAAVLVLFLPKIAKMDFVR